MSENGTCCLCGATYEFGNDPSPLAGGADKFCCDRCNWEKVLPARGIRVDISYDEFVKRCAALI